MLPPPFVLLEDRLDPAAGGRLYSGIREVIAGHAAEEVVAALKAIERHAAEGLHVAGYLTYEAFAGLEAKAPRRAAPSGGWLFWFGVFERVVAIPAADLDRLFGELGPTAPIENLVFGHDAEQHAGKVREVLDLIAAGDLYQVNLTFQAQFDYAGDPLGLYAALRASQPVAHGALVATGETWVLSVSPERFVAVEGGVASTRPMKGTVTRGSDELDDLAAKAALGADPKQRAENLMIVDLLRNDLARVCEPGSVRVPELFTVETYPTLHTLTSTVEGALRDGVGFRELMAALFPCGSVVGAPKIRAAQAISDLEAQPRGVYTGAIGAADPDGRVDFNVAIRTVTLRDGRGAYGVGGGIVADSDPAAEYAEALLKARPIRDLAEDFQLIETLRWTRAGFVRRGAHIARLNASAASLGFTLDLADLEAALEAAAAAADTEGDRRARILLWRCGKLEVSLEAPAPPQALPLVIGISPGALDGADPFLRHKTTRRGSYEAALRWAQHRDLDEAILLDRHGRVADASRANVFVSREGRLVTPPLHCGALAGVLRATLLAQGAAVEGELGFEDLAQGEVFLGSSLHGLRAARLA